MTMAMSESKTTPDKASAALRTIQNVCNYHLDWQEVPSVVVRIKELCEEGLEPCQTKL